MKAWFQRFMSGRYGTDQFNGFLYIVSLVLVVLGLFGADVCTWLGFAALVYSYFRMLSRNLTQRRAENQKYLVLRGQVTNRLDRCKLRFQQRGTYRYFRCPHCKQELRVPKGRGKVSITCPKCGTQFIKKS